jgi:hypothetical protein
MSGKDAYRTMLEKVGELSKETKLVKYVNSPYLGTHVSESVLEFFILSVLRTTERASSKQDSSGSPMIDKRRNFVRSNS